MQFVFNTGSSFHPPGKKKQQQQQAGDGKKIDLFLTP
jgi:hypothetical protein